MYADVVTASMQTAMSETARRRAIQAAYNEEHGITPTTILKDIDGVLQSVYERDYGPAPAGPDGPTTSVAEVEATISVLEQQMRQAAADLDFEAAAALRDRVLAAKTRALGLLRPPGSA